MDDNISIEEDLINNEEEDKKSQNKETKPKEFNEIEKYGTSQDVPNMNTPMNSFKNQNVQNNQLKEANTNINAPKIEEEANEVEETEKKNEEINNELEAKDNNENLDKVKNKINDIKEEIKEDEKKEEQKIEIKEDEIKEEEKKEDEKKEEQKNEIKEDEIKEEEKKEDEKKEDEKKEEEIKEEEKKEEEIKEDEIKEEEIKEEEIKEEEKKEEEKKDDEKIEEEKKEDEKKENEEPKLNKEESHEIKFPPENKDTKETKNDKIPDDENLIYPNEEDFDLNELEDKKEQNIKEDEDQKEKGESANDINIPPQNNSPYNNIEGQQGDLIEYENLPQQNIYEYPQMEGQYNYNEPIITIKDLQENPKQKLLINSPHSLKALYDCGITMNELYYRNLDEFINEHKEVIHISEDARFNRFNFYEQLRLDKIEHLVKYREKLIKEEQNKTAPKGNPRLKPMKKIIIDNHIRIAKDEIDSVQKRHEKELANIIELELDKDLFNLEIYKQEENYNKEYEKLNFLNLNSAGEETDNMNENENDNEQQEREYRYKDDNEENNSNYKSQNFVSASFRKKTHHIALDEHKTYLDNLYSLQQAKVNQKYEKNQKKIAKKLERVEKVNKIKGEQMALKKRIEIERASQNLQKNAKDYQDRHEKLLREIQVKKLSIYQNKKKFEYYLKEKSEHNYLRYMMKLDYIESLKRKDENLRQLKFEKLMEKQSRRENIKHERDDVLDRKFFKLNSLNQDRKRNIIKIKNILDTGVEEENLERILKAFPGNKEIDKVIQNYRNQKKYIQSGVKPKTNLKFRDPRLRPKSHGKLLIKSVNKNRLYNTRLKHKNSDLKIPNVLATNRKEDKDEQGDILINDNKLLPDGEEKKEIKEEKEVKVLYESEIRDKIKQYKENIYREFFRHVEEEKKNEDLRNKQLMNVHDPQKRHEMEKRFSKERALVDLRLKRENQNIQEKILSYEINLRQTNIDNQNLLQKKKK